jgi:predicted dehydrogenase
MTTKVGILGLGFMGNCHFNAYKTFADVQVTALCDIDPAKLQADAAVAGNIATGAAPKDLSVVKTYDDVELLLADPDVEVVDITLPTYLHAEFAIRALRAGKHVICEKPMAISSAEAKRMAAAAKKAGRRLFIGQCIRFWPAYVVAREIIRSRQHGKVRSAVFTRISPTPTWSWQQWLHDPCKSGSAALDLHIHDADYILYLFGAPKSVFSRGSGSARKGFDHIVTAYDYGKSSLIVAEGGWDYPAGFPFSMTFRVAMEKATLSLAADGSLTLYGEDNAAAVVSVPDGDGYSHELRHFIDCIANNRASTIVTPKSALRSVQLVEAEIRSAAAGKPVKVKF